MILFHLHEVQKQAKLNNMLFKEICIEAITVQESKREIFIQN